MTTLDSVCLSRPTFVFTHIILDMSQLDLDLDNNCQSPDGYFGNSDVN